MGAILWGDLQMPRKLPVRVEMQCLPFSFPNSQSRFSRGHREPKPAVPTCDVISPHAARQISLMTRKGSASRCPGTRRQVANLKPAASSYVQVTAADRRSNPTVSMLVARGNPFISSEDMPSINRLITPPRSRCDSPMLHSRPSVGGRHSTKEHNAAGRSHRAIRAPQMEMSLMES